MAKESINKVSISGKIMEITSRNGVTTKGLNYLGGNIIIETGEDNLIPVSFFVQEKTNAGKENPIYKSLQTVVKDYKTVNEHGRENADTIEIVDSAKLSENYFFVSEDRMLRGFQVNSAFFNRKQNVTPSSRFIITGDILNISEDVKDDVPTGTLTLRLLVIGYNNKANILDFKVEDPAGVNYVKTTFSDGMEVKVTGHIVIEEVLEELVETAAFGDPIVTVKRKVERKLIISSATPPISSSITEEEKNTMLAVRESDIKVKKEEFMKTNKGKTSTPNKANNFSL